MIHFSVVKKTHPDLLERMKIHYSQPKGFVGRSICYNVLFNNVSYGFIVGGSATKHLPGVRPKNLQHIVNNVFYSVHKVRHEKKQKDFYPLQEFTAKVMQAFVQQVIFDWGFKYGDPVLQIETLVEPPRTAELYLKAGFSQIGMTKGFTCKRVSEKVAGQSTDSYGGRRVWDHENLRPKLVLSLNTTQPMIHLLQSHEFNLNTDRNY